jgi:hypothetical protein
MPRTTTTTDADPETAGATTTTAAGAPASSTAFSGGSDPFVADAGPAFDPDAAGAAADDDQAPRAAPPLGAADAWDERVVAGLLSAKGTALHSLIGKADRDWIYSPEELAAAAPPLARILSRIPATAAAAGSGDELALMIALGAYVGRSVQERRAAIAAERDDDDAERGAPVFDPRPPAVVGVGVDPGGPT